MARYLVFAKTAFEQDLSLKGHVDAGCAEEAAAQAREHFTGDWVAMILIPEGSARWVVRHAP